MSKMVYAHVGNVHSAGSSESVFLRETKLFWVTVDGTKFRKLDGSCVKNEFVRLDLNSVVPVLSESVAG